ncbi:MAG: Methyltransferase type 11 [Verrucomicrobiales bacterium]|jgi:SAM-dependent methyltransferase|nr:Methyltransferase type 11 [Verrucomicrobiales bacterium]
MTSAINRFMDSVKKGVNPASAFYLIELEKFIPRASSVLDVGCGSTSMVPLLGVDKLVGIDGYEPDVQKARTMKTHQEIVVGDVRKLDQFFAPGTFDYAIASDVIEHLPKEDGLLLISQMEKVTTKGIIIFTPNGYLPQNNKERGDLQEHLSGWYVPEMQKMGFQVVGMFGPKGLRGEYHRLKYPPKVLSGLLSLFLQFAWTRNHPEKAAAILCFKPGKGVSP